jgi:ribosome recycling factor
MEEKMVKENFEKFKDKAKKTILAYSDQLKKIRTGRASTSILDSVMVNYYGTLTPVNQVASITVPEAKLIVIQPWDKSIIVEIEKAIQKASLGINPSNDGNVVRLNIPPLTEESRKEIVKDIKGTTELARVGIRNIRRDANENLKKALKDHEITEDEEKHALDDIQKNTDIFIKELDTIFEKKEKEILEV